MSEDRIVRTLRIQAWERAKGELNAVLNTYWADVDGNKFELMDKAVEDFVKHVENNGLQE